MPPSRLWVNTSYRRERQQTKQQQQRSSDVALTDPAEKKQFGSNIMGEPVAATAAVSSLSWTISSILDPDNHCYHLQQQQQQQHSNSDSSSPAVAAYDNLELAAAFNGAMLYSNYKVAGTVQGLVDQNSLTTTDMTGFIGASPQTLASNLMNPGYSSCCSTDHTAEPAAASASLDRSSGGADSDIMQQFGRELSDVGHGNSNNRGSGGGSIGSSRSSAGCNSCEGPEESLAPNQGFTHAAAAAVRPPLAATAALIAATVPHRTSGSGSSSSSRNSISSNDANDNKLLSPGSRSSSMTMQGSLLPEASRLSGNLRRSGTAAAAAAANDGGGASGSGGGTILSRIRSNKRYVFLLLLLVAAVAAGVGTGLGISLHKQQQQLSSAGSAAEQPLVFQVNVSAPAVSEAEQCGKWFQDEQRVSSFKQITATSYDIALGIQIQPHDVMSITCGGAAINDSQTNLAGLDSTSISNSTSNSSSSAPNPDGSVRPFKRTLLSSNPLPTTMAATGTADATADTAAQVDPDTTYLSMLQITMMLVIPAPALKQAAANPENVTNTVITESEHILGGSLSSFLDVPTIEIKAFAAPNGIAAATPSSSEAPAAAAAAEEEEEEEVNSDGNPAASKPEPSTAAGASAVSKPAAADTKAAKSPAKAPMPVATPVAADQLSAAPAGGPAQSKEAPVVDEVPNTWQTASGAAAADDDDNDKIDLLPTATMADKQPLYTPASADRGTHWIGNSVRPSPAAVAAATEATGAVSQPVDSSTTTPAATPTFVPALPVQDEQNPSKNSSPEVYFPSNGAKLQDLDELPSCDFAPTEGNSLQDNQGRFWSWMDGRQCAFTAQEPSTNAAKVYPSSAYVVDLNPAVKLTWDRAVACTAPQTGANNVVDADGKSWGWEGEESCAYGHVIVRQPDYSLLLPDGNSGEDTPANDSSAGTQAVSNKISNSAGSSGNKSVTDSFESLKRQLAAGGVDTVWENAVPCASAPTRSNTAADKFGRLWGWEDDGSCAFKL